MPSALHEALVMLFRECPRLGPMLLAPVLHIKEPEAGRVAITSAEFAEIDPPEYRADVVVRVDGDGGSAEDIFIIEVQLDIDAGKRISWPFYSTGARARFRCPATVVVIAVDERVASWCAQPIAMDRAGNVYRPAVIGPSAIPVIADIEQARQMPELAVLSGIAHGSEPGAESIGLAALAGCKRLDNSRADLYADLIFANLGEIARRALEALMAQHKYTYQSDFAKKYYGAGREEGREEGLEEGIEEGRRDTLRELLELRFGELPADVTSRLEQADAELLSRWTRRVLTAATLAEVFATDQP
jgi:hypothetical protein